MANMIIKPAADGNLLIQDRAGGAVLSTGTSGATISSATMDASMPSGTIKGYTRTSYTPSATQGNSTSNVTLTGSSVSYTPPVGASFVVYEYSAYLMGVGQYTLQLVHCMKNGSLVTGTNYQINYRTDGSFVEFSGGQVHFKFVFGAWSGAQTIEMVHQQWETSSNYAGKWHQSTYSGNDTGTDVWVDTHRTTYSVM